MSDHAKQNAAAWAASIFGIMAAYDAAHESGDDDAIEAAESEINNSPLSVRVRDDWRNPYDYSTPEKTPEEYEILLSTGGPALRVYGSINEHGEPHDAILQWQDWGTPWTDYHDTTEEQDAVILAFAGQFIQNY